MEAGRASWPGQPRYYSFKELTDSTPSRADGIPYEDETKLRRMYCRLIADAGTRLKLPQWGVATACYFCHRFYAVRSHSKNDRFVIATACLFLGSKVEDCPRQLNHVVSVCWNIKYKRDQNSLLRWSDPKVQGNFKEQVLQAERAVLYALGFRLNVVLPYKPLIESLLKLGLSASSGDLTHKNIIQAAWNFLNDSMRTTLCLQYSPEEIAYASLFLSASLLKSELPMPDGASFYEYFNINQEVVTDIKSQLLALYEPVAVTKPAAKCGATAKVASDKLHDKLTSDDVALDGETDRKLEVSELKTEFLGDFKAEQDTKPLHLASDVKLGVKRARDDVGDDNLTKLVKVE